jgi:hypothetical protein
MFLIYKKVLEVHIYQPYLHNKWCSPFIVGVFISFIFNFYYQCNNKKMSEGSKKNEDASGRIMIRHAPIRIAIFME